MMLCLLRSFGRVFFARLGVLKLGNEYYRYMGNANSLCNAKLLKHEI